MDIPTDFTGDGFHHGAMNRMMSSFFPGALAMPGMNTGSSGAGMRPPQHHMDPCGGGMMSPFGAFGGIPDLSGMFNNMGPATATGQKFSSSASSFVSMSSGPDGRPHVYKASSVSREGPGGLRETRKTLQDSRTGTKKMAVGRHMNDRGLVVEREQNVRTGQLNENHEFFNLDEEEVPRFDQEWRKRAQQGFGGRSHSNSMPTFAPQVAVSTGSGCFDEFEEDQSGYQPAAKGCQPQHSLPGVTIEELPASDEEEERQQQSCAVARHSLPSASAAKMSAPSAALRSKEKRQKRSRNGKKY